MVDYLIRIWFVGSVH